MHRFFAVIVFLSAGIFCAESFGQLVVVQDAVATSTNQIVTTTVVCVDGGEYSRVVIPGKRSEERKSKTKVVSLIKSELSNYGPPSVEFENQDGSDAAGNFSESEGSWMATKYGRYRVIAQAVNRETLAIKKQKLWLEIAKPAPEDGAVVAPNLTVLVVYETADASGQKYVGDIIASPVVTNYMRAKSVDPNGQPRIRFFDQHVKFSVCDPVWCKLLARKRTALPWVIIKNDESMFEGPLPSSVGDFLKLLKRYGG